MTANSTIPEPHRILRLPTFRGTSGVIVGFAMSAVLFLTWLFFLRGCDVNAYVPKAENLLRPGSTSHTFIVGQTEVTGVYGNMDVDSELFTYVTELHETDFWDAIDTSAIAKGWKQIKSTPSHRHYLRVIPKTGQQAYHSIEEIRVAYNASNRTVVVAWVQADTRKLLDQLPAGPEGDFAEEIVWPKFEALVTEQR